MKTAYSSASEERTTVEDVANYIHCAETENANARFLEPQIIRQT